MNPQRSAPDAQPAVQLHIEELILHGLPPHQRHAIGEAVEHELTALLSQPGALSAFTASRELPHLDAGTLNLRAEAPAAQIGHELARAIHGGLQP
jgi:hypothetical protein